MAFFIFGKDLIVKRMTQKSGDLPRPVLHIRIWGVSNDDLGREGVFFDADGR
jgi:hypothetical protein